jgi:uncharacterized membrane protein YidH (DUF202 family)
MKALLKTWKVVSIILMVFAFAAFVVALLQLSLFGVVLFGLTTVVLGTTPFMYEKYARMSSDELKPAEKTIFLLFSALYVPALLLTILLVAAVLMITPRLG